jgi:uncharacterized Fe-S cluster protein YjdI
MSKDENNRTYSNDEITVYWKPKECVHAGICFRDLRAVFDPGRRPWIDLSQATTAEIIDIVDRCPTDALTFEWNANIKNLSPEQKQDNSPDQVKFTIMRNGPILAEGNFVIIKENGSCHEVKSITSLCRCGMSKNKPYCDGSHNKQGFFPDSI